MKLATPVAWLLEPCRSKRRARLPKCRTGIGAGVQQVEGVENARMPLLLLNTKENSVYQHAARNARLRSSHAECHMPAEGSKRPRPCRHSDNMNIV